MQEVKIFVDGSTYHKTRMGGAGVYILEGETEHYFQAGYKDTTISRMEGRALHMALQTLSKDQPIKAEIFSDSEYIIKTFTEKRLVRWQMTDFNGVANTDMWRAILKEIEIRPLLKLKFNHVRGHQKGNSEQEIGNYVADFLASYKDQKEYLIDKYN